jgi:hypothetical protein
MVYVRARVVWLQKRHRDQSMDANHFVFTATAPQFYLQVASGG